MRKPEAETEEEDGWLQSRFQRPWAVPKEPGFQVATHTGSLERGRWEGGAAPSVTESGTEISLQNRRRRQQPGSWYEESCVHKSGFVVVVVVVVVVVCFACCTLSLALLGDGCGTVRITWTHAQVGRMAGTHREG